MRRCFPGYSFSGWLRNRNGKNDAIAITLPALLDRVRNAPMRRHDGSRRKIASNFQCMLSRAWPLIRLVNRQRGAITGFGPGLLVRTADKACADKACQDQRADEPWPPHRTKLSQFQEVRKAPENRPYLPPGPQTPAAAGITHRPRARSTCPPACSTTARSTIPSARVPIAAKSSYPSFANPLRVRWM